MKLCRIHTRALVLRPGPSAPPAHPVIQDAADQENDHVNEVKAPVVL